MINDWNESLKTGKIGENIVKNNFISLLKQMIDNKNVNIKHILYEESPTIQKSGIDFIFNIDFSKLDIKTRNYYAYKYHDILLETVSIVENNIPGWLYTSKSDIIIYAWLNKESNTFIDGYFLFLNEIRKYVNKDKYLIKTAETYRNGAMWHTNNIAISIEELILNSCIKRINFNVIYHNNITLIENKIVDKQMRFT